MKSVVDRMHENAMRHSRKAARLLREAASMARPGAPLSYETVLKVVDLNEKAIEECKQSARTIDFLLRYNPPPATREITDRDAALH